MPAIPFSKITQSARDELASANVEIKPVYADDNTVVNDDYGIINLDPFRDKMYKLDPWDFIYQINGILFRGTGITTTLYSIEDREDRIRYNDLLAMTPVMALAGAQ